MQNNLENMQKLAYKAIEVAQKQFQRNNQIVKEYASCDGNFHQLGESNSRFINETWNDLQDYSKMIIDSAAENIQSYLNLYANFSNSFDKKHK